MLDDPVNSLNDRSKLNRRQMMRIKQEIVKSRKIIEEKRCHK